jgi:hypothetical protein
MSEELQVLQTVAGRLDSAGIPYMVTGSMAVNYYAVPASPATIRRTLFLRFYGGDFDEEARGRIWQN